MSTAKRPPVVEVEAGESSVEVAQRIREVLANAMKDLTREELIDALAVSVANQLTLELVLHDLLLTWSDMSDSKRRRALKGLAQMISVSSGTEFIDVPGKLQ